MEHYNFEQREEESTYGEIERAKQDMKKAEERKRDESETKKIIRALEKEKINEYAEKKQLMEIEPDLRILDACIKRAQISKELIEQLRAEDKMIEERLARANTEGRALRAQFEAWESKPNELREQARLEREALKGVLKAQIGDNELKRIEERKLKEMDGLKMRKENEENLRRAQLERQALLKAKERWRHEVLENMRRKEEEIKMRKAKETDDYLRQRDELDRMYAERTNRQVERIGRTLQRRHLMSQRIGQKLLEETQAKEHSLTELMEIWAEQKERKIKAANDLSAEKLKCQMLDFQAQVRQCEQKMEAQKLKRIQMNREYLLLHPITKSEEPDFQTGKKNGPTELQLYEGHKTLLESFRIIREKREELAREKQQLHELMQKFSQSQQHKVEKAKFNILNNQPIEVLRYFPTSMLHSKLIPGDLATKIRSQVQKDPIPLLTPKRHQPHMRGRLEGISEPQNVECCTDCWQPFRISNVF